MKVTSIRYAQKQNLGNYETRDVEATAELGDGDDPATAWDALKRLVWAELAAPCQSPRPGSSAPAPLMPHLVDVRASAARQPGSVITDKQLRAIYAIARAARHLSEAEVDARCQELYHCLPAELGKVEASMFIDALKGEMSEAI